MPTFTTPSPIDLAIDMAAGRIEVVASDRADTVVTVSPTNEKAADRRGAERTEIDFDGTRLTVTGPRPHFSVIGPTESIDVRVELPTASRLTAELSAGNVHSVGRLGATRIKASTGAVDVAAVADLWVRASHGNVDVGTADGSVDVTADHGRIRIGTVTGEAVLKASHGSISVAESGGDLESKLSYGDFDVARARGSVTAKTSYGSIQLGEVSSGSVQVESGFGEITVGVLPGTPAWLDLSSKNGRVRNELDGDAAPAASDRTVAVRARTDFGDISVRRTR